MHGLRTECAENAISSLEPDHRSVNSVDVRRLNELRFVLGRFSHSSDAFLGATGLLRPVATSRDVNFQHRRRWNAFPRIFRVFTEVRSFTRKTRTESVFYYTIVTRCVIKRLRVIFFAEDLYSTSINVQVSRSLFCIRMHSFCFILILSLSSKFGPNLENTSLPRPVQRLGIFSRSRASYHTSDRMVPIAPLSSTRDSLGYFPAQIRSI